MCFRPADVAGGDAAGAMVKPSENDLYSWWVKIYVWKNHGETRSENDIYIHGWLSTCKRLQEECIFIYIYMYIIGSYWSLP